ncbi:unnamed protein product [Pleuronectes platessa]|uniref:Uncharacterized protein n=1 Tax=Pleuronectes platessa TaxID=8262 RepID=A0A9N7Y6C0_PLEPL|nr:unnamed protein product [Pleuronectes platessa]
MGSSRKKLQPNQIAHRSGGGGRPPLNRAAQVRSASAKLLLLQGIERRDRRQNDGEVRGKRNRCDLSGHFSAAAHPPTVQHFCLKPTLGIDIHKLLSHLPFLMCH